MVARYNLEITFGGEESEAPEDWYSESLLKVASMINEGYTCGEVPLWDADRCFRVFWTLEGEDN